jgi:hypothetical protein
VYSSSGFNPVDGGKLSSETSVIPTELNGVKAQKTIISVSVLPIQ